jgi:hypothetical protein
MQHVLLENHQMLLRTQVRRQRSLIVPGHRAGSPQKRFLDVNLWRRHSIILIFFDSSLCKLKRQSFPFFRIDSPFIIFIYIEFSPKKDYVRIHYFNYMSSNVIIHCFSIRIPPPKKFWIENVLRTFLSANYIISSHFFLTNTVQFSTHWCAKKAVKNHVLFAKGWMLVQQL